MSQTRSAVGLTPARAGVAEHQDQQLPSPRLGGERADLAMGEEDVIALPGPGQAEAPCR
jgi:hypothetical protein